MRAATPLLRIVACAALALLLFGCAPAYLSPLERDHPLVGRNWDTRAQAFVTRDALIQRAAGARLVLLGEIHDNADHHRLQAEVLAALLKAGRTPVRYMYTSVVRFVGDTRPSMTAATVTNVPTV